MKIREITENKRNYIDMLLLADPQEDMIEQYLDDGEMFLLEENGEPKTICVVKRLKDRKCELKNIVTAEKDRGKGYGKSMIHFICEHYSNQYDTIYVGTGNCRKTLDFYEKCGFVNSHMVMNFFVDHYEQPIYEDGVRLVDMVYLKKNLESEVDVKKVVDLALEAGRILLKNGAEIFRVEETITRICHRFHVEHVDIFTLSHGLFVSAENGMEEAYTKVKHVPLSASHLGIVAEVNALSREISAGFVGIDEATERLKEIDKMPSKKKYFQILAAGMASGTFGYMLGASVEESMITFGIGCVLGVWMLVVKKHRMSKIILNIVGGVIISTLAIAAQIFLNQTDLRIDGMVIGSIMPLVPGLAFVNAIRDIADSDFLSGTVRMIDAILVFVYIAVGMGTTFSIYNNMLGGTLL